MPPTQPRRILFFAGGAYVFGAEIIMLDVLRGLKEHGHDVHCVVSSWNDGDFIRRLNALGIPHSEITLGFFYLSQPRWTLDSLRGYPGALRALLRIRRELAPEVIYYQGYRNLLTTSFLFDVQHTLVHVMETETHSRKTRLLYGAAARRARTFVAISRFIARDLVEKGVRAEQVEVVYPAVSISHTPAPARAAKPNGVVQLGIVGQLIPRKGHEDLLHALQQIRARGRNFQLHVFGRGPEDWSSHLRELCARLGIADAVTWHGFVDDRSQIYPQLDAVVVPTRDQEAFGLVAAEPALWGLPVIAAAGGGLPEIIEHEVTGLLFRTGDVSDLAAQLDRLLADPELRARMGSAARTRVGERFSQAAVMAKIEELVQRHA